MAQAVSSVACLEWLFGDNRSNMIINSYNYYILRFETMTAKKNKQQTLVRKSPRVKLLWDYSAY